MSDQSKSPRLEGDELEIVQQKDKFTLREAARYWAGYLQVFTKHSEAVAKMDLYYATLKDAAKQGRLGAVEPKIINQNTPTRFECRPLSHYDLAQRTAPKIVWGLADVSREALRTYAKSMGKTPEFLFPEDTLARHYCR